MRKERINITEKLINDVVEYYKITLSKKNTRTKFNISQPTLVKILKKNGIKTLTKITINERNNIIHYFKSLKEIPPHIIKIMSEKFKRHKQGILQILKEEKLYIPRKHYKINQNYFEKIDQPNKAYWLGFIAADGNVSKSLQNLSIRLNQKDVTHLEKFKNDIEAEQPIKYFHRNILDRYGVRYYAEFNISNVKIVSDLIKHGIIPAKTFKLKWEDCIKNIPENYIVDFVRGYFDGDGCWKILLKNRDSSFSIASASFSFITGLQQWSMKYFDLSEVKIYERPPKRNEKVLYIYTKGGGKNTRKIMKKLYNGNICLERKYKKITEFLCYLDKTWKNCQMDIDYFSSL